MNDDVDNFVSAIDGYHRVVTGNNQSIVIDEFSEQYSCRK